MDMERSAPGTCAGHRTGVLECRVADDQVAQQEDGLHAHLRRVIEHAVAQQRDAASLDKRLLRRRVLTHEG